MNPSVVNAGTFKCSFGARDEGPYWTDLDKVRQEVA
jgi:hypothetical protein